MQYGRYQIIAELGRGSMGVVYKAHDPQIDRTIALKVLREDRVTSDDFVRRFLKEAMAVGKLSHPAIVTVYDVGQDHGSIYIAMEFLQGIPLDEAMATRTFSLEEVVDIGIQTAEALHYAHHRGIVHRDIKPPNIILSPEGSIHVTDFGIARIEDPNSQQLTQVGQILGTPRYMSPEQAMGQPIDGRSDLYSLGVILYQMTTGQSPYRGDTLVSIFRAITQTTPEAPHLCDQQVPKPLSVLIMKLLAKQPSQRFATGEKLISDLRGCLYTRPPTLKRQAPLVVTPPKQRDHRGKTIIYCFLFLVISLGAGSYYYLAHWKNYSLVDNKVPVILDNLQITPPISKPKNAIDSRAADKKPLAIAPDQSISANILENKPTPQTIGVVNSASENQRTGKQHSSPTIEDTSMLSSIAQRRDESKKTPEIPLLIEDQKPSFDSSPKDSGIDRKESSERGDENIHVPEEVTAPAPLESKQKNDAKNSIPAKIKKYVAQPVGKQSHPQKQVATSSACQAMLKRFKLGDASVIKRFQKECSR